MLNLLCHERSNGSAAGHAGHPGDAVAAGGEAHGVVHAAHGHRHLRVPAVGVERADRHVQELRIARGHALAAADDGHQLRADRAGGVSHHPRLAQAAALRPSDRRIQTPAPPTGRTAGTHSPVRTRTGYTSPTKSETEIRDSQHPSLRNDESLRRRQLEKRHAVRGNCERQGIFHVKLAPAPIPAILRA